jgi:chromosome segregation protein
MDFEPAPRLTRSDRWLSFEPDRQTVQLSEHIQKAVQIADEKRDIIKETEVIIETDQNNINQLQEQIKALSTQKEHITSIHKNFFTKREELSTRMTELDKECFRLNGQRDKLMEQADLQMTYMWEEYELTYTTALSFPIEEEINITQTKKSIAELKGQIKELGDVNVNAIEDYKNLSERFEFLTAQKEDLVKSEEALLQIIQELDTEMRKQFLEKFQEINAQFDVVFKELFGGGHADLELTESEDILEAGIRINAQPPGKKLQNMMQLSGGEKALTAISLLFAIQNLKPSQYGMFH